MIYEKLLDIIKRVMPQTDTSKITMESSLTTDLGVDSLNMMLLAITVEDEFNFRFETTSGLNTVKDICDYVETHANI